MQKLKLKKKELTAHQQFKRELAWKQAWGVIKKILLVVGITFFFLFCTMFYFAKICINKK